MIAVFNWCNMEKYFAPQVFPISKFRPLWWPSVWNRHMCFGHCYLGISCLATPGHILTQLQTFCQRDRGVLTPEWDVSNFTSSQSSHKQCQICLVNRLYLTSLSVLPVGSHGDGMLMVMGIYLIKRMLFQGFTRTIFIFCI